ncbi:MAG: hypothetical protein H6Q89_3872 [Myxococcaceae bacterium]|nr:hypothetical protein [Myxococcaceae bacterium]
MKFPSLLLVLFAVTACTPPGPATCKLTDATPCTGGLVCERVKDKGNPYCFQPVLLKGTVKVLGTTTAIANAEVSAVDVNGVPSGAVATSDGEGAWTLRIETERSDEKGTPIFRTVTLRAAAQDFQPFPSGVRTSLPIDTSAAKAEAEGKPLVLASSQTDLALAPLADAEKGNKGVSGTVELTAGQPALVVLEGSRTYTTSPGATGAWHLFNVAPGTYKAQAYSKGSNYTAVEVTVVAGTEKTGVEIKKSGVATATMMGSVSLVAGANGAGTSVVMAVESTFIDVLARGELVPGLRAPESGAPTLSGSYTISGIPDGKYVVLAAFENDGNVRDPDPNISGTQISHVSVANGVASANPVFKVTGAIEMVSPGAGDTVEEIAGTPTFTWKPYSSAKSYELVVFSAQGTKVWENLAVLDIKNGSGNIAAPYNGPALKPGVVYQWRATARGTLLNPISMTEDLKGLFLVK